jgi:prepilin-type N-terminal cleavage/methylation domain-containing protein
MLRKRQQGFSLIELLIVVAILLVIAAVAIPNLLHSKLSENEAAAVSSLRTLNSSCVTYAMLYGGYPKSLSNLGPGGAPNSASADLIDAVLASGAKSGYVFAYTAGATGVSGNVLSYSITANPMTPGTTGQRGFFTDQSGVIRAHTAGAADASSTPIG